MDRKNVRELALAAMFLAIGQVLPFVTGQIPAVAKVALPMHYPVILCGFFCGWKYGAIVGFICPLLRSVLFGMPVMYPGAVGMAFELLTYGAVSGFLFAKMKDSSLKSIYLSMIPAMIAGRIIWGLAMLVLFGVKGNTFTLSAFTAGAFTTAAPGIIAQLVLIPLLLTSLKQYLHKS